MVRGLLLICAFLLTACASGSKPPALNAARIPVPIIDGRWFVETNIPAGQPHAGRYWTFLSVTDVEGRIHGSGEWSNGARSKYDVEVEEQSVHLGRLDANGFRATFDGTFSADGHSISGTGQNDPSSPNGNSASYTWWAARVFPPPESIYTGTHCDVAERSWAIKYVTQERWQGHPDPDNVATKYAVATVYRCSRVVPLLTETIVDGSGRYASTVGGSCLPDVNLTMLFENGLFIGASRYEGPECPEY